MINLKNQQAGTTDIRLENSKKLDESFQKFNDTLQEIKFFLIEAKEMHPIKKHLLLTPKIENLNPPKYNSYQKLIIVSLPVLGYCIYKFLKR